MNRAWTEVRGVYAGLAFLWLAGAGMLPCQEPPRPGGTSDVSVAVRSQLVEIYFTVTDGRRRIVEVRPQDLTLYEDGIPQAIERLDTGSVPLRVALLLDTSESMRAALYATQEAAVSFVESLSPGDRVILIPFSSEIRAIPQATDDRSAVIQAIRSTQARGATKLYDALMFAMKQLSAAEGRKALVVFSDGEDTARTSSLDMVLNAAARYGYPIYAIYAGSGPRAAEFRRILRRLADVNSGRMFMVEQEQDLRAAFAEVAAELRSAFVLHYYTRVPPDGRWHDLKISPANRAYQIHSRRGFYAAGGAPTERSAARGAQAERSAAPGIPRGKGPPVPSASAASAAQEILGPPVPLQEVDLRSLRAPASPSAPQSARSTPPVIKVETRFVEVPVLVETPGRDNPPLLSEKDFRVYENEALRELVFFSRDVQIQDLPRLRDMALRKMQGSGAQEVSAFGPDEAADLVLARFYLVLDDLMTEAGTFMQAKQAAERILRKYHSGLRRFSLHFASEAQADLEAHADLEHMIQRLKRAVPRPSRELTTADGLMSIYEAYLVERGDVQAAQLAELRYASDNFLTYSNPLGEVIGIEVADPQSVQLAVTNTMRTLVAENFTRVSRMLDGLKSVVSAASLDSGSHPRTVIFISAGFVSGRTSGRADLSSAMDGIVEMARAKGIRIFTVDAAGLSVPQPLSINSSGAFLARNPHLFPILYDHDRGWQVEKESSLTQLASDTGGRFLHNTNDLVAAAGAALDRTGRLYYLGYLSNQPADGRFHRIRVATSLEGARLRTRSGYYAGRRAQPETLSATNLMGEDWDTVFRRAEQARLAGDWKQLAESLEQILSRFPGRADLWYNLGAARLRMGDAARAVGALQKAFALAPENTDFGLALSRALVADGFPEAAADTLKTMIRGRPHHAGLLVQLGRAYEAAGRPEEAYQSYRKVLDLTRAPTPELYLLLVRTSMEIGRRLEAEIYIHDFIARGGAARLIEPFRLRLEKR